uniref:Putative DNA binding, helix-turn-helix domain containing protein n=1 Tax=viral metagenome TaxID=1070528 RepID=A0A6H1ZFW7_9ZZZZ
MDNTNKHPMAAKKKPAEKAKTGKHPGGRPTKFNKEVKAKAEKLSRRGFIDREIAEILGVSERTVNRWKIKQPEFCQSLNLWKEHADENVERSLYERACGSVHADTKAQWVETTDLIDGKLIRGGKWVYADMVKHYPPDPTSMIFWLKNRRPETWRDKTEHDVKIRTIDDIIKEIEAEER